MRRFAVFIIAFAVIFAGCPGRSVTKEPESNVKQENNAPDISGSILYARDAGFDTVYSVDPEGQKKNQIYNGEYSRANAFMNKIIFYSKTDSENGIFLEDMPVKSIKLVAKDYELYSKPAFSPDGNSVAFLGQGKNDRKNYVYVMKFSDLKPVKINGIKGSIKYLSFLNSDTLLYSKEVNYGDYAVYQLFKYSLINGREENILKSDSNDKSPIVSPDGQRIAYLSDANNKYNLYTLNLKDKSIEKLDLKSAVVGETLSWSPDSRYILYTVLNGAGKRKVKIADAKEKTSEDIGDGYISAFSPDGKYIIYASYDIMGKKQIIYRRKLGEKVSEKVLDFPEDSRYSRSIDMLYWTNFR